MVIIKQFVIATHGTFAEGIYHSLRIIMGNQPNITTFCAYVDDYDVEKKIDELMNKFSENEEVIVFTDLFGGSINNYFLKYIKRKNFHLIAGVSLPLLLEVVNNQNEETEKMILNSIQVARGSFKYCNKVVECEIKEDFNF